MYRKPDVPSSYAEFDLGRTIYTIVMTLAPKIVVEVGTLYGYSAICILQALHDLGEDGHLICCDLWDGYEYKHTTIEYAYCNIINHGFSHNLFELNKESLNDVVNRYVRKYQECPILFDKYLFHIDVSNDGDIIKSAMPLSEFGTVIFEGGTSGRDNVEWMWKYNKTPIVGSCDYKIIDHRFPGISMMR